MTKTDIHLLRAKLQEAIKEKNLDGIVKYRNLLLSDRLGGPDLAQYLAITKKKYDALVISESEAHIRSTQRALCAVLEWLQKGDGLQEFEEEFFNEDKLNKVIENFHQDADSDTHTDLEEAEDKNFPQDTMTPRRAAREWAKIERELEFLQRPHFATIEVVPKLFAEHAALAPAMRERMGIAEVRKSIASRGAGRRFARVRAALACSDAGIVLRHYAGLREDAEFLRAQYPANPAAQLFAARAEGLANLVEENKETLGKQKESEKEAILRGVRQIVREVKEVHNMEQKIWTQTKGEADSVNVKFKQLTKNEEENDNI